MIRGSTVLSPEAGARAPSSRAKSRALPGRPAAPPPLDWAQRAAPWFVWIVFAGMLAAAHVFVVRYASPVPFWDDLGWAEAVDGRELGWRWWWSPHNEHRIPLPRLFLVPLLRLTGDFRAGMHLQVLVFAAVALAMILAARRLRGRTSFADAFFPLLWLSWSSAEAFLMMHMLSFVLPTAMTSAILLWIATRSGPLTARDSVWIGACLFGLPLCGGPGVTPAPALILWALYAAWNSFRSAADRRAGVILAAFAVATALLIGAYFIGYENPHPDYYSRDVSRVAGQSLRFLSLAFGPAAQEYWPLSGAVTVALLIPALLAISHVLRTRPEERVRAAGLLAVGLGVLSMALSAGIARGGGAGDSGFAGRYVPLPAPLFCAAYFATLLFGPRLAGRCVRACLCALFVLLLPFDVRSGSERGANRREQSEGFLADLAAGLTIRQLALRHWTEFALGPRVFELSLRTLHDARFGPLAAAAVDPDDSPYFMFKTAPARAESTRAVSPRRVGDEFVLLVHPPCELGFDVRPGATRVEGRFGLHPGAYEALGTSGARFSVEWRDGAGATRTLFERVLRPVEQAGDRGFQALSVALPAGAVGELLLRASYAPDQGDEHAWCCWTDVEIR